MDDDSYSTGPLIGLVGPCAAGKSTIGARLRTRGYRIKHIAQEHSYVQDMWLRITKPDILIFLDAEYSTTVIRRKLGWRETDWAEQQRRLAHARQHAHLYIQTDALSIEQVEDSIIDFVKSLMK